MGANVGVEFDGELLSSVGDMVLDIADVGAKVAVEGSGVDVEDVIGSNVEVELVYVVERGSAINSTIK